VNTKNGAKLNQLFNLQKAGTVLQSSWLKQQGYSHDLQQQYKRSNWLRPIGVWFTRYDWEVKFDIHRSSFLDPRIGLINREFKGHDLAVSSPARAVMECLYLADKAGHEWIDYINATNIDLGKGKRSIVRIGIYVDEYRITVPKELDKRGRLLF